jgi:hypothetical protein
MNAFIPKGTGKAETGLLALQGQQLLGVQVRFYEMKFYMIRFPYQPFSL